MSSAYVPFSVNVFVPKSDTKEHLNYITALLNSKLMFTWFNHRAKRRGVGLEINGNVLAKVPIRLIDFTKKEEKAQHDHIVDLVTRMLDLQKQRAITLSPPEQLAVDRQIAAVDQQIDQAVYGLYGLTPEEIALVEGA